MTTRGLTHDFPKTRNPDFCYRYQQRHRINCRVNPIIYQHWSSSKSVNTSRPLTWKGSPQIFRSTAPLIFYPCVEITDTCASVEARQTRTFRNLENAVAPLSHHKVRKARTIEPRQKKIDKRIGHPLNCKVMTQQNSRCQKRPATCRSNGTSAFPKKKEKGKKRLSQILREHTQSVIYLREVAELSFVFFIPRRGIVAFF